VEFRILGPLSVRDGGEDRLLRGTTQRALLAVLLLNRNRVVPVDTLLDELWGDEPPDTAVKIIHNGVSQLRRLFDDPGRLATQAPGYVLRVEPGELDAARFEQLAEEGRVALDEGHPAAAAELLGQALALWNGQALADVALERMAHTEVGRLEDLRLTVLEDRTEALLALGRHRELVAELEALVAEHPLRERLRLQLVLALYRAGRQAEALDAYRKARRFFVDELGLEPSPPLQQLEQAILRQDPSLDLAPAPPPRVERPAPPSPPPRELRKTVTVLVVDLVLRGEQLDPEAIRPVATRATELAATALERHGASVERPAGGELIGVFGLPQAHEDDALRAARAALELRDAVRGIDEELAQLNGIRVETRTGIHTGEVVAPASGARVPVAGDAVTLAARLAQSAEPGEILLGTSAERLVREAAELERPEGREARLVGIERQADAIPRRLGRPMIGRQRELEQLRQALARADAEHSAYLFTILGPAGIGKSRLAAEFAGAAGRAQASVLTGRCLPYGEGITFWPLAEVVRQAAGESSREAILRLVEGRPEAELIADRVAGAIGLADAAGAPEETFWAARKLLEAIADPGPLVLIFDDLHWAEPTFLDLIEHIADATRGAPILIVCLARPELVEERRWWAGGKLNATSLLLDPLSTSESDELIDNLLGGAEVSAVARLRAVEAAEGNPLFLEQLLMMVVEEGASLEEVAVPPTIHLLLEARLDRLQPEERAVIEGASVVGKEFWPDAVVALSPESERADVPRRLEQLVRRELIRPSRALFLGSEAFRFRHTLIRETAYLSVPKEVRAELHERFADWLDGTAGGDAPELAELGGIHLEQAYRYRTELLQVDDRTRTLARRAAERLAGAGRRASSVGDMPAALRLLTRAEALLADDDPRDRERLELLLDLVDALRETGDFRRARAVLDDVVAAVRTSGDAVLSAIAVVHGAQLDLQTNPEMKIDAILKMADAAIEVFERSGDERHLAEAWRLRGRALWFRCRAGDAEEALRHAMEFARRVGDSRTEAQALNVSVGAAFYGPLPVAEASRFCEEILARPGEQRRIRASALRALAGLRAMEGRFDEARGLLADSRAILEDIGLTVTAAAAAETAGLIELLAGDLQAAERELRTGYDRLERMGGTSSLPMLAAMIAQTLYLQGRDDEALRYSELSARSAAKDDPGAQVLWRSAQAKVIARMGRLDAAEELSAEAVALAETTDFLVVRADALADRAEVLFAADRAEEGEEASQQAFSLYEQKGAVAAEERARRHLSLERGTPSHPDG
jgi:DNA-binding SARP family transcriptional activator